MARTPTLQVLPGVVLVLCHLEHKSDFLGAVVLKPLGMNTFLILNHLFLKPLIEDFVPTGLGRPEGVELLSMGPMAGALGGCLSVLLLKVPVVVIGTPLWCSPGLGSDQVSSGRAAVGATLCSGPWWIS